ncbi:MAG: universal stress protein [Desulfosalsimonas sp.]
MFKDIKSLLFATDLTGDCRPALENSVAIASRFQATLVLFHVIDGSVKAEDHFISLMGKNKWEAIKEEHEKKVHETLIGKMSSKQIGENVLSIYSEEAGIDSLASNLNWEEIVVEDANIAGAILNQAKKGNCDLIVLGNKKGFLEANALGSKIKELIRKSKIPVMVVPS